ncbi:hypothetical protein D3C80_2095970 [compost metagenome]
MQSGLNELLGKGRFRMREHFADGFLLDQFTVADYRNAVANALNDIHLMSNKKDGQPEATVNVFQ